MALPKKDNTIIGNTAEPDKTAVALPMIGYTPKKLGESKGILERITDRATEAISNPDRFRQHMKENFFTPNQDIVKDYMEQNGSTFGEAMKWAIKEDAINDPNQLYRNNPNINPWYMVGMMIRNETNKELNKRELKKSGIKRIN